MLNWSLKPLWALCPLDQDSHAHNARRPSLKSRTGAVWLAVVGSISYNVLSTNASVDTYICTSCNLNNEAKKPWLLQHVADPDDTHTVLHTLALAIDSSVSSETELTMERRVDLLEKKLEEQAAASRDLKERMEEGFRLLHQVLADKLQSSSG
jgi:hypothetical protein